MRINLPNFLRLTFHMGEYATMRGLWRGVLTHSMVPNHSCPDQKLPKQAVLGFTVGWMEVCGQNTGAPLYLIILVERAWICREVWLMPTQLYFSIFSLNNCKLFITNSSCSIFAWNHKNKNTVLPQTCFTLQSDFRALQRLQNMQSSPLLLGKKQTVLDVSYCHELWALYPEGATAPWEANWPKWTVRAQAQRPCLHHGFLCSYSGKLGDIWSLHLYQLLKC